MSLRDLPAIAATLLPQFGGAIIGSRAVKEFNSDWQKNLKKAPWSPPGWVFGPMWTTLYAGMGYASYLVWRDGNGFKDKISLVPNPTEVGSMAIETKSWVHMDPNEIGLMAIDRCPFDGRAFTWIAPERRQPEVEDGPATASIYRPAALPLAAYGTQLALNWAWTPLFFGCHSPKWGLIDISLLDVSVWTTTALFYRVNRTAGHLMIPYITWLAIATSLNFYIYKNNPEEVEKDE